MAYYPKSQVKTNLYTNGGDFVYKSNNNPYEGPYFKTSKGKFFTGKSPIDGTPVELIVPSKTSNVNSISITQQETEIPLEYLNSSNIITPVNDAFYGVSQIDPTKYPYYIPPRLIPLYHKTKPTPEESQLGKYNRYFCKKNNELIYIEISRETYNKLINKDPQIAYDLYTPTSILWQNMPSLNFAAVNLIERDLKWYGFSQYFKGNFES